MPLHLKTPPNIAYATLVALSAALCGGCGGTRDRVVVQGKVSYDGARVLNGDIRFYPSEGTRGSPAGAPIKDGLYNVINKDGVPVGVNRVVIRAFILEGIGAATSAVGRAGDDMLARPTGRRAPGPKAPVYLFEGREQFLPPQYNAQSTLRADISGDENPMTVDFDLE